VVAAHNNSSQSLLAVRATAEVATAIHGISRWSSVTTVSLRSPGSHRVLDFDLVDEGMYSVEDRTYVNAFWLSTTPEFCLPCQGQGGVYSVRRRVHLGDYETKKDVTARRTKNMAILTHLVEGL